MNVTVLLWLLCAVAGISMETVQVPVLAKISSPGVRYQNIAAGFYADDMKYVWAFQFNQLQDFLKEANATVGYYSDLDNNPATGRSEGWDLQFNIRPTQMKLDVLQWIENKAKGVPLYPDDYLVQAEEDVLYIVIRREAMRAIQIDNDFSMRIISNHTPATGEKSSAHLPRLNTLVNREKTFGVFSPPLNFPGFGVGKARLTKIPQAVLIPRSDDLKVWNTYGERYEETEAMPEVVARESALKFSGARGEREALHFAVSSKAPFKTFEVIPGKLTSSSGTIFPASALTVFYLGFATDLFNKNFIDVLYPSYVPSKSCNHFAIIDAFIPSDASPGIYSGSITLKIDGQELSEKIPYELEVFKFTLPDTRSFKTAYYVHPRSLVFSKAAQDLVKSWGFSICRLNLDGQIIWGPSREITEDKQLKLDWEKFDRACELAFRQDKMTVVISSTFQLGSHDKLVNKMCQEEFRIGDPASDELIRQYATLYSQHLKELGLSDKFIFILWDEPYSSVYGDINHVNAIIKKAAPELRTGLYIDSMPAALNRDAIDVWMFVYFSTLKNVTSSRSDNQNRFWVYNDVGMGSYEFPASVPRLYYWLAKRYGIDGYLYWSINTMTKVEFRNGAIFNPGVQFNWIYPGETQNTPLPSLRMLLSREGLDDYEYLEAYMKLYNTPSLPENAAQACPELDDIGEIVFTVKTNRELQDIRNGLARKIDAKLP